MKSDPSGSPIHKTIEVVSYIILLIAAIKFSYILPHIGDEKAFYESLSGLVSTLIVACIPLLFLFAVKSLLPNCLEESKDQNSDAVIDKRHLEQVKEDKIFEEVKNRVRLPSFLYDRNQGTSVMMFICGAVCFALLLYQIPKEVKFDGFYRQSSFEMVIPAYLMALISFTLVSRPQIPWKRLFLLKDLNRNEEVLAHSYLQGMSISSFCLAGIGSLLGLSKILRDIGSFDEHSKTAMLPLSWLFFGLILGILLKSFSRRFSS